MGITGSALTDTKDRNCTLGHSQAGVIYHIHIFKVNSISHQVWRLGNTICHTCNCTCVSHSVMSDFCDLMDCSLADSSVYGILQARILEWVGIPFFREISWTRDRAQVSLIADGFFTIWATWEDPLSHIAHPIFTWLLGWPSVFA